MSLLRRRRRRLASPYWERSLVDAQPRRWRKMAFREFWTQASPVLALGFGLGFGLSLAFASTAGLRLCREKLWLESVAPGKLIFFFAVISNKLFDAIAEEHIGIIIGIRTVSARNYV
jgi:hypothetical protein